MNHTIDQMLSLTAEIADELLMLKDSDSGNISDGLKLKIITLAELAADTPATLTTSEIPASPATQTFPETPSQPEPEVNPDYDNPLADVEEGESEAIREADHLPDPESTTIPETVTAPEPAQEPAAEETIEEPAEESIEEATEKEEIIESALLEETEDAGESLSPADISDNSNISDTVLPADISDNSNISDTVNSEDTSDTALPADTPAEEIEALEAVPYESEPVESEIPQAPVRRIPLADMQRAFSINDAFLFRREIFGGSKDSYLQSLEYISTLPDLASLRHYLETYLGLDLEQSPGKDFYQSLSVFF